jgi:NADH:ubiquinone oxidoreductase subunit 2 (subunit N)
VIVAMYMADDQAEEGAPEVAVPAGAGIALAVSLGFTVLVGFLPQYVFDFARHATILHL